MHFLMFISACLKMCLIDISDEELLHSLFSGLLPVLLIKYFFFLFLSSRFFFTRDKKTAGISIFCKSFHAYSTWLEAKDSHVNKYWEYFKFPMNKTVKQ